MSTQAHRLSQMQARQQEPRERGERGPRPGRARSAQAGRRHGDGDRSVELPTGRRAEAAAAPERRARHARVGISARPLAPRPVTPGDLPSSGRSVRRLALAALGIAMACHSVARAEVVALNIANPFYAASTLPFQAPPFDRIRDEDYQPAIEAGIAQQEAEIRRIANNPAAPTFENTIVALEKSGQLLTRVTRVFTAVTGANMNPTLQKVQTDEAPKLAAHHDNIFLNSTLFRRVAAIHRQREALNLDAESRRLVEYDYDRFVHAGANLSAAGKAALRKLNAEESSLSDAFTTKVLAATREGAFATARREELAGLSDERIAAAAQAAKSRQVEGFVLTLRNTTQQPDLAALTDRATRQAIFERSWGRTEHGDANDTRDTVARLAQLRAQKANLLGFPSFAAWTLQDQMVKTPEVARQFMAALIPAAVAKVTSEAKANQDLIDAQHGGFQLQPWDWSFYAEQVRKARYNLDEAQVRPYLELTHVLQDGIFYAANLLYGVTFKERHDIPVYHPDVRVFEVTDADGKPLALYYCDYFARDSKSGGTWMSTFVDRSQLLGYQPAVYGVANLTKPAPGQPALLSFREASTLFQEFGHALRAMFDAIRYPSLSGQDTARDFIEFPSQFNGHLASEPSVFAHYALHFKTGEPMPQALAAQLTKAESFNKGYDMTEVLAAAELDMQWHSLPSTAPPQDSDAFERQALEQTHLDVSYVPPRYRTTYFNHIWLAGGFNAGFYAYLWTQMLADDAYEWFGEHGGLTRANGERFRRMILARGNSEDLAQMYETWRGAAPTTKAMLRFRLGGALDDPWGVAEMKRAGRPKLTVAQSPAGRP